MASGMQCVRQWWWEFGKSRDRWKSSSFHKRHCDHFFLRIQGTDKPFSTNLCRAEVKVHVKSYTLSAINYGTDSYLAIATIFNKIFHYFYARFWLRNNFLRNEKTNKQCFHIP